ADSNYHPLFLQSRVQCLERLEPTPAIVEAAKSMLSTITANTRSVLKILSIFFAPVDVTVLARLCGQDPSDIKERLTESSRLGLTTMGEGTVYFTHSILRNILYQTLPKRDRVNRNRTAFLHLSHTNNDLEILANHAFEAGMFQEAAKYYCELGSGTYN